MLVLGIFILLSVCINSWSQSRYHVRPRPAFATVTINGITEQSEQMQFTTTLFEDEGEIRWDEKIQKLLLMRESRLQFQNERLLKLQAEVEAEQKKAKEEAKAAAEAEKASSEVAKTVADGVLKGIDGGKLS